MKLQKSVILMIALIIWSVFSVVYIGWSSWQNFKAKQVQVALSQGYQQAFVDIANVAQKCEAVPLNLGKDKDGKEQTMEIVATQCLKQAQNTPSAETPATPSTTPKK